MLSVDAGRVVSVTPEVIPWGTAFRLPCLAAECRLPHPAAGARFPYAAAGR
jgi:hypothetical protein